MPHTLTLAYHPLLAMQTPPEDRQGGVLLAIADAAVPQFLTLWRGLFTDVRQAVRWRALIEALRVHRLEGRNYLAQLWEQSVEDPAWRLLVTVGTAVMQQALTFQERAIRRLTEDRTPLMHDTTAAQQALDTYVGTEIRDITQTSMTTVQRLLRGGQVAGQSHAALAQTLRQELGLTPRQHGAVERMRARLRTEGRPVAEVTRLLDQAIQQGLQRRAGTIARTESLRVVHLGAHQAWQSAVAAGRVDVEHLRRYWRVRAGACAEHCAPIPGMNPDGVGLNEQFQTPAGPMLLPPRHPQCRCHVVTRVRGTP